MTDQQQQATPKLAIWLGYGGLAPFVICAAMAYSSTPMLADYGLIGAANYGAVILSFVGAIHWGLAMQDGRNIYWFSWSVTPALLAWAAISLLDVGLSMLALVPAFVLSWSVDRQAFRRGLLPACYMRLRHILTGGAVLSLLFTAFAPAIPYNW